MNSNFTILLIENNDADIAKIQRAFRHNKIDNPLLIAHSGSEALKILKAEDKETSTTQTPKMIILDIVMPDMSGFELLEMIRGDEKLRHLMVFMLTRSFDREHVVRAYNLQVAGYINKPENFDEFSKAIAVLQKYWSMLELPQ